MIAAISIQDFEDLKAQIMRLLPDVKSSHRVEALARGLGYGTNAALRALLKQQPAECTLNDAAFNSYLHERGASLPRADILSEAMHNTSALAAISGVLTKEPHLSRFGFGVFGDRTKPLEERRAEFRKNREEMLHPAHLEEFVAACRFLSKFGKRVSINRSVSSYGLKHRAERHFDEIDAPQYIANGMLIAAAIHLGFRTERDGPNAYFNISLREQQVQAAKHRRGNPLAKHVGGKHRVNAWRNMMIAAINEGLDQGIFGLEANDNRWSKDHGIYHFHFQGMPAIACVNDAGYGELAVHVAVNPTQDAERWITSSNAGRLAGDAFASGWMEREKGKWLQSSERPCNAIRRDLLPLIASARVEPKGYKGEGKFMF